MGAACLDTRSNLVGRAVLRALINAVPAMTMIHFGGG